MESTGKTLRVLRTLAGLSQRRVAKKLDGAISDQTISNWEKGDVEPEEGNLRQLLRVFELSLAEFESLTEVMDGKGEDAMISKYEEIKDRKGRAPEKVLTAANAVRILQWVATMNDAAREDLARHLSDEDARVLLWTMAQKIKPLPVVVKQPIRAGESSREEGIRGRVQR